MTLLPEVEHALLTAIRAPDAARSRRRLLGPAVTAALVLLTLVVAVGALIVPRDHGAGAPASGGNTRAPVSRQELLDSLGVLRRPQAGPRLDEHALATLVARRGKLDSSLVRTVNVATLHDTVALLPVTAASRAGAPVTERLAVAFLTPAGGAQAPVTEAMGVNVLRAHGISAVFAPTVNDHVVVVPDGVLQVRIDHVTVYGRRRLEVGHPRQSIVTATVDDNVAGFALGPLLSDTPGTARVEGVPAQAQTTWLGLDGRVIARPTVHLVVWVLSRSVRNGTTKRGQNSAFCRQNPRTC